MSFLFKSFSILITLFCISSGPFAQDCIDGNDAHRRIMSQYTDLESFPKLYEQLSTQCRELIATNQSFQREVSLSLDIVNSRFNHPDRLNRGDLKLLEQISGLIGQRPSQENIQTYNNHMKKIKTNCTPKDQRTNPKLPPIRDQSSVDWCYSYTAADLVSFNSGKNISAIDMAVNHNNQVNLASVGDQLSHSLDSLVSSENIRTRLSRSSDHLRNAFSGVKRTSQRQAGDSVKAINKTTLNGFCLESELPSSSHKSSDLGQTLENINFYDEEFRSETMNNEMMSQVAADIICTEIGDSLIEIFGNVTLNDIAGIMKSSHQVDLLSSLTSLSCKNRISVTGKAKDIPSKGRMDQIDSILENDSIVGIDYYAEALGLKPTQTGGMHASSIIGRQWNDESQQCEYLVRNSWGETCEPYLDPSKCEKGNIWVDRDALRTSIISSYHFE
jgi:hypothetical protein